MHASLLVNPKPQPILHSGDTSHGSYNLEKVLNLTITSRLEKSLNSVYGLEKYLISLLGLEKSGLKNRNSQPSLRQTLFSVKLDYFAEENLAHSPCKNLSVKLTGNLKAFLCMNNILFLCFSISNAICVPHHCKSYPVILQSLVAESAWYKISVINDGRSKNCI